MLGTQRFFKQQAKLILRPAFSKNLYQLSRFWTVTQQLRFHKINNFFFVSDFIKAFTERFHGI
jgi:hypothetical protein